MKTTRRYCARFEGLWALLVRNQVFRDVTLNPPGITVHRNVAAGRDGRKKRTDTHTHTVWKKSRVP